MMLAKNLRNSKRFKESPVASVKGKDRAGQSSWNESAEVVSYSKNGASLYLSRERTVGSLVSLLIALPVEFRAYDEDRELYRVWGIIQHCSPVQDDAGGRFLLGIAFIGRAAPPGHLANPARTYRIIGNDENGMWKIAKTDRAIVVRKHPRYWVALKIVLSAVGMGNELFEDEETVTENISLNGTCAIVGLDVQIGGLVEFAYPEVDFSAVARVCNVRQLTDNKKRINLEFIDAEFPIDRIVLPADDDVEAYSPDTSDA